MGLRGKFRAMIHISNIAWSTKYSKVRNIGLFTSDKFMGCFLQELVEINLVDDMTCSIDSFSPEPDRSLVFSKHCSGHFNKSLILPFNHTILLRCICRKEFMSETISIKKSLICVFLNSVPLSLLICLNDTSYSV